MEVYAGDSIPGKVREASQLRHRLGVRPAAGVES